MIKKYEEQNINGKNLYRVRFKEYFSNRELDILVGADNKWLASRVFRAYRMPLNGLSDTILDIELIEQGE